jgi:hypothetical protein
LGQRQNANVDPRDQSHQLELHIFDKTLMPVVESRSNSMAGDVRTGRQDRRLTGPAPESVSTLALFAGGDVLNSVWFAKKIRSLDLSFSFLDLSFPKLSSLTPLSFLTLLYSPPPFARQGLHCGVDVVILDAIGFEE